MMLTQLLERCFATIPNEVISALTRCSLDQPNILVNPALEAETWQAFLAHLPQQSDDNP